LKPEKTDVKQSIYIDLLARNRKLEVQKYMASFPLLLHGKLKNFNCDFLFTAATSGV